MQSSMWKLLTAAGIIGIGTLVVLEVQNRLPVPARTADNGDSAPPFPGNETNVVPDDSAEIDRLLSGMDAGTELSFDLNEPADTGAPAPPVDDHQFVGVTPVNQTVLKDSLTDDINPFVRSFEEDTSPTTASNVPQEISPTPAPAPAPAISAPAPASALSAAPVADPISTATASHEPFVGDGPTPSDFTNKSVPVASVAASERSKTIFFNGQNANDTEKVNAERANTERANAANTAANTEVHPPAAAPVEKKVVPASRETIATSTGQSRANGTTGESPQKTVDRVAYTSAATDETPEFFLPEAGSAFDEQKAPKNFPPSDAPLMETPGFEADPAPTPEFELFPRPESPTKPGGDAAMPDSTTIPERIDNTPFFPADEPAPRPAVEGVQPNSPSDSLPPFEPDTTFDTPRPRPGNVPVEGLPAPTYPDRNAIPDLNEKSPFDNRLENQKPDDGLNEPFDLPTIDNRLPRVPADQNGVGGTSGTTDRTMSKVMRPQLSIQKRAPDTATVGISHDYTIVVSNDGDSPAYDVVVDDELGNGAQLVNSKPAAEYDRISGKLNWSIRELGPKSKQEIVVRITPTGEGTLDGIATVRFKAQVKSATVITAPKLMLELVGPKEVKVGDEVRLHYVIRNNGSGDASKVILRSVLPPGLKHSEGGDLEYEIDVLAAGDREEIDLTVVAAEPGHWNAVSEVTASGISADKATTGIDIIGSQLTIQRLGPDRRFVGRSAKFQNIIANETNFEANNAVVMEQVPEGMRFVTADNGGEFNPQTRQISWQIPRLAPGKQTVLEVELEALVAGQQQTAVEVIETAGFRSRATENTVVTVEDYENMTADISRQDAPVAIGETFGFTITIENRGTAVAKGVEMAIEVPQEIDVKAAGTRSIPARRQGNTVRYAIVPEIPPGEKMMFELKLQGQKPAQNAVVRASLKYEQMREPLIVSESVTIFDDRP